MWGSEDSSLECGAHLTVLWNVGRWGQFCGMWDNRDSSMECGAVGTVLWNVKR